MEPADDDARFLFLWIAFNAAYAREIPERDRFSERRVRMNCLRELIGLMREPKLFVIGDATCLGTLHTTNDAGVNWAQ